MYPPSMVRPKCHCLESNSRNQVMVGQIGASHWLSIRARAQALASGLVSMAGA